MISGKAALAGVMGWPVSHSLSPRLHQFWLSRYGVDGAYIPLAVRPEHLMEAFSALPKLGFRGWNVTVPYKEQALKLVHELDAAAQRIGAVNTVVVRSDGLLFGSNTDAYGFAQNLETHLKFLTPYLHKAVVIGAGGAARAILAALRELGFKEIVLVNRTEEKAQMLASSFGHIAVEDWKRRNAALSRAGLLVNATTLGMEGQPELELDLGNLPAAAAVCDIVYRPLETKLLKDAKRKGCRLVPGLGMLIHQARPGFKAWFGTMPEVTGDLESRLLEAV